MLTFLSAPSTTSWRLPTPPAAAPLARPTATGLDFASLRQQELSVPSGQRLVEAEDKPSTLSTLKQQTPNAITLAGYALGLWWSVGGPTWAAIVSILADELDGRLARSMGTSSDMGSKLDWGADVALVPMSLLRLGRSTNLGAIPLLAAPPILWNQSDTRADGWRPPIGSWRASIMAATILVELLGNVKRTKV